MYFAPEGQLDNFQGWNWSVPGVEVADRSRTSSRSLCPAHGGRRLWRGQVGWWGAETLAPAPQEGSRLGLGSRLAGCAVFRVPGQVPACVSRVMARGLRRVFVRMSRPGPPHGTCCHCRAGALQSQLRPTPSGPVRVLSSSVFTAV